MLALSLSVSRCYVPIFSHTRPHSAVALSPLSLPLSPTAQCGVVKEFSKDFHKMQLGRGGKCLECKGGIRTTNLKPQQQLIGMIFINADPRYAGRFDDKQGGDPIVTMKRVRVAIAFNAELLDESTSLFLASLRFCVHYCIDRDTVH